METEPNNSEETPDAEEFERRLARVEFRTPPLAWRNAILRDAVHDDFSEPQTGAAWSLGNAWRSWLAARGTPIWGLVGAAWVLVLSLNSISGAKIGPVPPVPAPLSPTTLALLLDQRREFLELTEVGGSMPEPNPPWPGVRPTNRPPDRPPGGLHLSNPFRMTLQRFLNGFADSRCTWLGIGRFKPPVDQPMSWSAFLAQVLLVVVSLGVVGLLVSVLLLSNTPMKGSWWPLTWALSLGLVAGLFATTLLTLAWNRRAAALRRAGLTLPPPVPKRRPWQTWLVAPFYSIVLFVVTPLALWLAIENALGTWAWRKARADLVARGEPLTMQQLLPPRPPDDQNFATTPLLRPLLDYATGNATRPADAAWKDPAGLNRPRAIGFPSPVNPTNHSSRNFTNDGRLDLTAYARGIRARPVRRFVGDLPASMANRYGVASTNSQVLSDVEVRALEIPDSGGEVLTYLQRFDPEMKEIAEAIRRPHSQFPIHWDEGFLALLPHISIGKQLSSLFRVRAAARLQKGDAVGAYTDTVTTLLLADMLATEPLLISLLVRIAQTQIATIAVWEGLAARRWDDTQLADLQARLSKVDLRDAVVFALQGERIQSNNTLEQWITSPKEVGQIWVPSVEGEPENLGGLGPTSMPARGLLRRNQIYQNRLYDALIARFANPDWTSAATNRVLDETMLRRIGLKPMTPYNTLAAMLAPAFQKAEGKAARQVTTARMGAIACAIERHRLRTGRVPETLDELVPSFFATVPLDPMNQRPFHYQRLDSGWFRLWSVGLNGRDDGGSMKSRMNDDEGDWVWPIPVPSSDPRLFGT